MKNCKVELKTGVKTLAEVKIQRAIFQWDALSLLLFAIDGKDQSTNEHELYQTICQKWKKKNHKP